jgi:hypothetical protein
MSKSLLRLKVITIKTEPAGKPIRYQEVADQSNFPILCIKGIALPNRYSVRLFAPRVKAHVYPKLYWATFAEGEGQKLCLLEGNKYWYLQNSALIDSSRSTNSPRAQRPNIESLRLCQLDKLSF